MKMKLQGYLRLNYDDLRDLCFEGPCAKEALLETIKIHFKSRSGGVKVILKTVNVPEEVVGVFHTFNDFMARWEEWFK